MKDPSHRETRTARAERFDALARRAAEPLYRDPFEGLCAQARRLSPADRAQRTQTCPRCGIAAIPGPTDPEAGCLFTSLDLDLAALKVDQGATLMTSDDHELTGKSSR